MQDPQAVIEIHIIFHGNVQGVGFRATTYRYASQLGLKGTVRNCSDGTVEAYLQGPLQVIEQLLKTLNKSHSIDEIFQEHAEELHRYQDFQILY